MAQPGTNMATTSNNDMHEEHLWNGIARALPIVLGYLPIGFAFGVLAQKAGLTTLNTLLLSILVYAGSAQLIAVGLFAAAAPALSIIVTTFIVNLRHLLMSAALSPYLKGWRKRELAAFAYQLTDETFAVHATQFATFVPRKVEIFATNITAQLSWVAGTWLGIVAGQLITDVRPLALDYALPAMFIALLILQLRNRVHVIVAILAGLLALSLLQAGVEQWNVIMATVIGATLGLGIERWIKQRSS
jgi:4-azaleucine resistance transporter AzlC